MIFHERSGLYLPEGCFAESGRGQDLLAEVATRGAGWLGGFLGVLPDPDPVLRQTGDGADVLENLAADDQVTHCIQHRKTKTLNQQAYSFKPGTLENQEPTPGAKALCADLERDLERVDLHALIGELLDAPYHGMTVVEPIWAQEGGRYRIKELIPKPREWFGFSERNRLVYKGETGAEQVVPHPAKFVAARHLPTFKNPYGLRLLSRCLFPVAFKKGGVEFLMRFADKYGTPWTIGEAALNSTPEERREMVASLAAMHQRAVAVVTAGSKIQLVEHGGKATDLHLRVIDLWNRAVTLVILGQTLTQDVDGGGSYAASETHYQVLTDYAEADQALVAAWFNDLAWHYGQLNAPGELAPVFSYVQPEDQAAMAALFKDLHGMGMRPTAELFKRRFGLQEDEFTVEQAPLPGSFSEPAARFTPDQQALENLVESTLGAFQEGVDQLAARVVAVAMRAETPEEIPLLVFEEFAADGLEDLTGLHAPALAAASLAGRFAARADAKAATHAK